MTTRDTGTVTDVSGVYQGRAQSPPFVFNFWMDGILIRILADLLVNHYTLVPGRITDPVCYRQWLQRRAAGKDNEKLDKCSTGESVNGEKEICMQLLTEVCLADGSVNGERLNVESGKRRECMQIAHASAPRSDVISPREQDTGTAVRKAAK